MARPEKAIIIGSGIAGISTSIRLAVLGLDVTVFEANDYPGGGIPLSILSGNFFSELIQNDFRI